MAAENANQNEEVIHVSGTLDAVAAYIETEFGLNAADSAKAATLLWLEQECELAEAARTPALNIELKSLEDFSDQAQGMVANSRVFLNLSKMKADVFGALPQELIEDLLCKSEIKTIVIKALLHIVTCSSSNAVLIREGLACVCMRAWNYVKGREHIPFQVEAVMPSKEFPHDLQSPLVCDLTQDDGTQRMNVAKWECPHHKEGNYCVLTPERAREMLNVLVEQGVLEYVDNDSYAFL